MINEEYKSKFAASDIDLMDREISEGNWEKALDIAKKSMINSAIRAALLDEFDPAIFIKHNDLRH